MRTYSIALGVLLVSLGGPYAETGVSLGATQAIRIQRIPDDCSMSLFANHDDSFENAYCWQQEGVAPPYFGAFGEAFDLGQGEIECVAIWATTGSSHLSEPMTLYVWRGGIGSPPGEVLYMRSEQVLTNIPFWPSVGQNNLEVGEGWCVNETFTVGYWADFSLSECWWYVASDESGVGGYPWTNIAPGIGYPTGWQDPSVVWESCRSLGIGVFFDAGGPSPAQSPTWGRIKVLF